MWVFARGLGFISIVADDEDENYLHVRARKREHLERITPGIPSEVDAAITETPDDDYRWRARIARDVIAEIVMEAVFDVDYTSHVKEEVAGNDKQLYTAMLRCWSAMHDYQEDRESGLTPDVYDHEQPGWDDEADVSDPQEASQEAEDEPGRVIPSRESGTGWLDQKWREAFADDDDDFEDESTEEWPPTIEPTIRPLTSPEAQAMFDAIDEAKANIRRPE